MTEGYSEMLGGPLDGEQMLVESRGPDQVACYKVAEFPVGSTVHRYRWQEKPEPLYFYDGARIA